MMAKMSTYNLFVYGTIGDAKIFQQMLGRIPEYTTAKLNNYKLFIHPENRYLFIQPYPGGLVEGKLVQVNEQELKILDWWEAVPLYQREILNIEVKSEQKKAFAYVQNETKGLVANQFTPKDKEHILADIKEFICWMKNNHND